MSKPDLELWHAIHDECPPEGCGHCVTLDVQWPPEQFREIRNAAHWLGEPVDVFIHRALLNALKTEAVV